MGRKPTRILCIDHRFIHPHSPDDDLSGDTDWCHSHEGLYCFTAGGLEEARALWRHASPPSIEGGVTAPAVTQSLNISLCGYQTLDEVTARFSGDVAARLAGFTRKQGVLVVPHQETPLIVC